MRFPRLRQRNKEAVGVSEGHPEWLPADSGQEFGWREVCSAAIGKLAVMGIAAVGALVGIGAAVYAQAREGGEASPAAEAVFDMWIRGTAGTAEQPGLQYDALVSLECTPVTQAAASVLVTGEIVVEGMGSLGSGTDFTAQLSSGDADCGHALAALRGKLDGASPLVSAVEGVVTQYGSDRFSLMRGLEVHEDINRSIGHVEAVIVP